MEQDGTDRSAEGPGGIRIIIDGHHRTQAAIEAGLDSVPVTLDRYHPSDGRSLCKKY